MSTDLNTLGYSYDGETVEVTEPINADQHAGIFSALGVTDGIPEYDRTRRESTFEPAGPAQGDALRRYLRKQGIAHASERRDRWTPGNDTAASTAPYPDEVALEELVALADEHDIHDGELDEHVHDAASEEASEVNNRGVEAQIRCLVDMLGAKQARRIVESEGSANEVVR